jgi:hypothetical protein
MKIREIWGISLVILGVVIEALFTFALLTFDEGVSHKQQSKIIALETEIAPRRLTGDECHAVARSMSSYSGTVRVRSYTLDLEAGLLAWEISDCLALAKTLQVKKDLSAITPVGGFSVGIFISGSDTQFVSALRKSLANDGKLWIGEGSGYTAGSTLSMTPGKTDADVLVAVKPLPEMIPK